MLSLWREVVDLVQLTPGPADITEWLAIDRHCFVRENDDLRWTSLALVHRVIRHVALDVVGESIQPSIHVPPERIDRLLPVAQPHDMTARRPEPESKSRLGLREVLKLVDDDVVVASVGEIAPAKPCLHAARKFSNEISPVVGEPFADRGGERRMRS